MTNPLLAKTWKNGTRIYENPETGQRFPSVTTVIANAAKPALLWWSARMAAERALDEYPTYPPAVEVDGVLTPAWEEGQRERVKEHLVRAHIEMRDAKANIGTEIHELVEAYVKDQPIPAVSKEAQPYVAPLIAWLGKRKIEVLEQEASVWNESFEYAGTLDCLWKIDEVIWLLDVKTTNDVYPEVVLQVAALAKGDFLIRPRLNAKGEAANADLEPFPKPANVGILHVVPDTEEREGWVDLIDVTEWIEEGFEGFVALRAFHEWKRHDKAVLELVQGKKAKK